MPKECAPRFFDHGPRFGVDTVTRRVNSREVRTEHFPRVDAPEFGSPAPLTTYGAAFDQARTIAERIADSRDEREEIRQARLRDPDLTKNMTDKQVREFLGYTH